MHIRKRALGIKTFESRVKIVGNSGPANRKKPNDRRGLNKKSGKKYKINWLTTRLANSANGCRMAMMESGSTRENGIYRSIN